MYKDKHIISSICIDEAPEKSLILSMSDNINLHDDYSDFNEYVDITHPNFSKDTYLIYDTCSFIANGRYLSDFGSTNIGDIAELKYSYLEGVSADDLSKNYNKSTFSNLLNNGISKVMERNPDKSSSFIYINKLLVDEEYRGRGIGEAILYEFCKYINREYGNPLIFLISWAINYGKNATKLDNECLNHFYRDICGFKEVLKDSNTGSCVFCYQKGLTY